MSGKPPPPTAKTRQKQRKMMLAYLFGGSIFIIVMGFSGWNVGFIPAYYLGFFLLIFGILGLCKVNIWKGGPLDPQDDPDADA